MGQIVGLKAKPKRCNLNALGSVPTPAAGEYILVSYDNSMTANGQGNFDRYIIGDGRTAATALELKYLDDSTHPYIVEEVNKAVADIQPIEITGDVTNAPDEEDLTSENQGGTDVLKFKDKAYNAALYSGLGRIYLRKNISGGKNILTQAMVNKANTIYHIQYDYDLNGQTITLPVGCVLEFGGGGFANGMLVGNGTIIANDERPIFANGIVFGGTFANEKAFLSWFKYNEDATNSVANLFKICQRAILNKGGNINGEITAPASLIEVDGMGNTFNVSISDSDTQSASYTAFLFSGNPSLCLHDIRLNYGSVVTSAAGKSYAGIRISMPSPSVGFAEIYNVEICGFNNTASNPCDFIALWVSNFDSQNSLSVHDIFVHDNIVLGDGSSVTGVGGNHAVRIQTSAASDTTGTGDVYNIHCKTIVNANPEDVTDITFQEDSTGLYLCAPRTNENGFDQLILIDVHDCIFEDCSLRAIKVQGNNAKLRNIKNILTTHEVNGEDVLTTLQTLIIDFQGVDNYVEGLIADCASNVISSKNGEIFVASSRINVLSQNAASYLFNFTEHANVVFDNVQINITGTPVWCVFLISIVSTSTTDVNETSITLKNSRIKFSDGTNRGISLVRYSGGNTIKEVLNLMLNDSDVELSNALVQTRNNTDTALWLNNSKLTIHGNVWGYQSTCLYAKHSKIVSDVDGGLSLAFYGSIIQTPFIVIEDVEFQHKKTANSATNILNISTSNSVTRVKDFRVTNTEAGIVRNVILLNGEHKLTSLENVVMPATYGISCKSSAGLIEVKNCAFNYFSLTENTPATIAVEYDNDTDPVAAMLPYITRSVRAINLSSLPASGQKGVTYWYSGKPIYWNGSAFVDATGAAV